jgi:hypothetical protein
MKWVFALQILGTGLLFMGLAHSAELRKFETQMTNVKLTATLSKTRVGDKGAAYSIYIDKIGDVPSHLGQKGNAGLIKVLQVPVQIKVRKNGVEHSYQSGVGDIDWITGHFSNFKHAQILNLLEEFTGTAYNIGVGFMGRNKTKLSTRHGIILSDSNITSALSAEPGGSSINAGYTHIDLDLIIKPAGKVATEKFTLVDSACHSCRAKETFETDSISIQDAKYITIE